MIQKQGELVASVARWHLKGSEKASEGCGCLWLLVPTTKTRSPKSPDGENACNCAVLQWQSNVGVPLYLTGGRGTLGATLPKKMLVCDIGPTSGTMRIRASLMTEQLRDVVAVKVRCDLIRGRKEPCLGCHSAQDEDAAESIIVSEDHVRVETVAHHTQPRL